MTASVSFINTDFVGTTPKVTYESLSNNNLVLITLFYLFLIFSIYILYIHNKYSKEMIIIVKR